MTSINKEIIIRPEHLNNDNDRPSKRLYEKSRYSHQQQPNGGGKLIIHQQNRLRQFDDSISNIIGRFFFEILE